MIFVSNSLDETNKIAKLLAENIPIGKVIALIGILVRVKQHLHKVLHLPWV